MLVDAASEHGDTGGQSSYCSAATMRKAPTIAMATSMTAAGRSKQVDVNEILFRPTAPEP